MIRKELFKECMESLKNYNEWEHKLYELGIDFWEREEIQDLIISYTKLLEYACKDEYDDVFNPTNISYFIYDCDWGKNADEYFITEKDGTEIKFKTIDDLWNYLVKCHPEIEDKSETTHSESLELSQEDLKEIFMENFTK